eukprot:gene17104-22618_t
MFGGSSEEDHLYDFNTSLDAVNAIPGTAAGSFNRGFKTPGTAARPLVSSLGRNTITRNGAPASRMGLTTGINENFTDARPMTSVSGAGYKGNDKNFDPLNLGRGPAPLLAEKSENSFEDKAKEMEKQVHRLIEATADAIVAFDYQKALEKAKEAGKSERLLCKFRENHNLVEQINLDLTYAICFNLANAYYYNKLYDDALNTYSLIVKNKNYPQSGRLKLNMGVIYYEQKKYPQAIKQFRMALDQIPVTNKELRLKIMRNIGNSFVKLGQFQDAIDSYEGIMNISPDVQTAFNLMLCLYARGDKDKMRKHFTKVLSIPIPGMTEEDEEKINNGTISNISLDDKIDLLNDELVKRYETFTDKIFTISRLIAPIYDEKDEWVSGYQQIMEQLKGNYELISSKLEIDLAMVYMKDKKFDLAIDILKSFERKDVSLRAMAATNLSFIYFLENDFALAEKQADIAIQTDRYNAKALVNKGNCLFMANDYARAREMYLEAVGAEADCIEAIYNLGLVNIELNAIEEAKNAFNKLLTILPSVPEALFQLGLIYEKQNLEEAAKIYERLLTRVNNDPHLCSRLGQVYEKLDDENSACHWRSEAHRHYPVNLNDISWLGVWYVKREMYEQAIEYFNKASGIQPSEVKWNLMVASCYRRLGDFYKALDLYQQINEEHPDNIEALQYLEALCKDLGRPHDEISKKLDKVRRYQPQPTKTGATTRNANQPQQIQQNVRSERPKQNNRGLEDLTNVDSNFNTDSNPSLAARRSVPSGNSNNNSNTKKSAVDDEDDFIGTDVTTLLV